MPIILYEMLANLNQHLFIFHTKNINYGYRWFLTKSMIRKILSDLTDNAHSPSGRLKSPTAEKISSFLLMVCWGEAAVKNSL